MKNNYDLIMENIIEEYCKNSKPKLLLHSCCAPCSSSTLERLIEFFDITILFYNPNISPKMEYEKRLEELKRFVKEKSYNIEFLRLEYDDKPFKEISKGLENLSEGGERCFRCYRLRLEQTAKRAKEGGYDFFTTTLSISPHKNSDKLNEIGKELQEEYGVKYLFSDFKKKNGYKRSIELSKQYNLYRQDYCGCVFSKIERENQKSLLQNK